MRQLHHSIHVNRTYKVQENEQVALKYQKEFQQAEEQHRLRVKKAAKELPTVLKALKRDLEGSSKDVTTVCINIELLVINFSRL